MEQGDKGAAESTASTERAQNSRDVTAVFVNTEPQLCVRLVHRSVSHDFTLI